MILLKEIHLVNFLSHKDTTLAIGDNDRLLIDGASGAGKSAIVEGLIWCLYGKGRSSNRQLINLEAKEASVSVTLTNDEGEFKIERTITNKGGHTLTIYEKQNQTYESVSTGTLKDTQSFIEQTLLHASYFLFTNSIAYPQDNPESFVKQTAVRRKDLILEIINAEDYDSYYKKARETLAEEEGKKSLLDMRLTDQTQRIEKNKEAIVSLQEYEAKAISLNQKIEQINNKIKEINELEATERVVLNTIKLLENKLQDFEPKIKLLPDKITSLEVKKNRLNELNVTLINQKLSALNENKLKLKSLRQLQTIYQEWQKNDLLSRKALPTESQVEQCEARIVELNQQILDIMRSTETFCPEIGRPCPKLQKQIDDQIKFLTDQLSQEEKQKIQFNKAVTSYQEILTFCPAPSPVNQEEITVLEMEIDALSHYEREAIKLENIEQEKKELDIEIDRLKLELEVCHDEQNQLKSTIESHKASMSNRNLHQELQQLSAEHSMVNFQYVENLQLLTIARQKKTELDSAQEELKTLEKEIIESEKNIGLLQLVAEAFGPNGIKAIVIDYITPRLEDKINDVLAKFSDFKIRLETQKSGVGKDVTIEGLFINIINPQGEELEFTNYSGGERMRIVIAIAEGLADLSKQIGFRILDEAIVGLDQDTAEGFANVIVDVQDRFQQLLCVSHLPNIKDMFQAKVDVVKLNGVSKILC